jgi:hypothetical protein
MTVDKIVVSDAEQIADAAQVSTGGSDTFPKEVPALVQHPPEREVHERCNMNDPAVPTPVVIILLELQPLPGGDADWVRAEH